MNWSKKVIESLFPEKSFAKTPYYNSWKIIQNRRFYNQLIFLYSGTIIAYIGHFHLVDSQLGITETGPWFYYRYGIAAFAAFGLVSLWIKKNLHFHIVYFALLGVLASYLQALSMIWYDGVHYLWGIFLACISPLFLPVSLICTVILIFINFAVQLPAFVQVNIAMPFITGSFLVVTCLVIAIKSDMVQKIDLFWKLNIEKERAKQAQLDLENSYKRNLQAAHDLGSPVSTINAVASKLRDENLRWQKLLQSSVDRITQISNELITDHQQRVKNLKESGIDLENVLTRIIRDKSLEYKDVSNLSIDCQFDRPIPTRLSIPAVDFERAISNILNNSIDAMTGNDRKAIEIRVSDLQDKVQISIKDNGCGIPINKVKQIFEPDVTFKESGTGIGLSFVKEKVLEWGGQVRANSLENQGTTIEIEIPYL